jgi:hypothetical protein
MISIRIERRSCRMHVTLTLRTNGEIFVQTLLHVCFMTKSRPDAGAGNSLNVGRT